MYGCLDYMLWYECACLVCTQARTGHWTAGTGITDDRQLPCRCWELNPGPLQEQPVFLTTMPSLKAQFWGSWRRAFIPKLKRGHMNIQCLLAFHMYSIRGKKKSQFQEEIETAWDERCIITKIRFTVPCLLLMFVSCILLFLNPPQLQAWISSKGTSFFRWVLPMV